MHFGWFWCLWLKFWFTLVKQMKMVWLRLMAMIMIYFVVYFVVLLYNTRSYNKRQCFSVIFSLSFSQSLWALLSFNLLFSAQTHSIIQVSSETVQCWIYLWECITNRFSHIIHVMTPFLANILCSILIFYICFVHPSASITISFVHSSCQYKIIHIIHTDAHHSVITFVIQCYRYIQTKQFIRKKKIWNALYDVIKDENNFSQ